MPLQTPSSDPRPRNPFGQFASGTSVTPDQMNRAYGIRKRVLASSIQSRVPMKNIAPISQKDIGRIAGLAERLGRVVELASKGIAIKHAPFRITRTGVPGELRVAMKGATKASGKGYFTDDVKDARGTAALMIRKWKALGRPTSFPNSAVPMGSKYHGLPYMEENARWAAYKAGRPTEFSAMPEPPIFVNDGGYKVKVQDGNDVRIGKLPGFTNRLRRNKIGIVASVITAGAIAREILRANRLRMK